MEYVRIAKVADFDASPMRTYRVIARRLGIFRAPDGSFSAMEMLCRHQNADLSSGRVQGDVVTCPRHGWRYNLKTGECLEGNGQCLRRYGVKVENGLVYVSIRPEEE